jgi:hypothetical protein
VVVVVEVSEGRSEQVNAICKKGARPDPDRRGGCRHYHGRRRPPWCASDRRPVAVNGA